MIDWRRNGYLSRDQRQIGSCTSCKKPNAQHAHESGKRKLLAAFLVEFWLLKIKAGALSRSSNISHAVPRVR